jgi:hypothetical protein
LASGPFASPTRKKQGRMALEPRALFGFTAAQVLQRLML